MIPSARQKDAILLGAAVFGFVLVRVLLFPGARNYFGDAIPRAETAAYWAAHPRLVLDPRVAYDIAPLQVYLAGPLIRVLGGVLGVDVCARLPNLLCALATLWPVVALARRTGARHAAALSIFALTPFSLHLQSSLAASSEVLFVCFLLAGLDRTLRLLDHGRAADAALAGLFLLLAQGLRFDGWFYGVGVCAAVAAAALRRRVPAARAALCIALVAAFPLTWMAASIHYTGDPLWNFTRTGAWHVASSRRLASELGELWFRARSLLFWPGVLLLTLTPGVFVLGLVGAVRAWRMKRPGLRLLLALVAAPPILLTFQAAVLGRFGLMSRFTIVAGVTLTLLVALGWEACLAPRRRAVRLSLGALTVLLAIALPAGIALRSHDARDAQAERLRALSPLSDLPPAIEESVAALRTLAPRLGPGEYVLIDSDAEYSGHPAAFYGGLRADQMVRVGLLLVDWRKALVAQAPRCALLFRGSVALRALGVPAAAADEPGTVGRVVLGGRELSQRARFDAPPGGIAAALFCREDVPGAGAAQLILR